MKKVLYGLNCLVVVALMFGYLSPFIEPKHTWFFSLFAIGFPLIVISNLAFILYWLIVEPKYILLSFLSLLIGFSSLQNTIGFNKTSQEAQGLKVMSYNIGNSRFKLFKKDNKAAISNFRSMVLKAKPDIICLQERHPKLLKTYQAIFKGYNLFPQDNLGTAIYCKYPITAQGNIPFNSNFHNATWIDIKVKKQNLRIYSIHLKSNQVPNLDSNVKEIWDESWPILKKYNTRSQKRVEQINKLIAHAQKSPHPVIICGDFNDVAQSYLYRRISQDYKDAFKTGAVGIMKTMRTLILGLRIDYTFVSPEIPVLRHYTIESNISDHYPLMTILDVNDLRL